MDSIEQALDLTHSYEYTNMYHQGADYTAGGRHDQEGREKHALTFGRTSKTTIGRFD